MDVVETARSLAPEVRARAEETERARTLPADLATSLARAGLFRTLLPRSLGGLECAPLDALAAMEAIGTADAATGWCTMIGATSGMSAAWLEPAFAALVHADPETVTAGVFAPIGRAVPDGDAFVVSGRWPWFSGHAHCSWYAGGCTVLDGGTPRMLPNGMPDSRMFFFPAEAATRLDGWHVAGLCGTGSGEVEVEGLRVARERSVSLVADAPREGGPLYRMPPFGLLAQGIAFVMLGNARGAIDDLVALAGAKRPQGSRRTLAERGSAQTELARAEASLRAARGYCVDAVGDAWRRALNCGCRRPTPPGPPPTWPGRCTTSAAARRSTCRTRCSAASATRTWGLSTPWWRRPRSSSPAGC
jgi:alkylation response protein AidB-like acyl-CoA dehydrogenase